MRVARILAILVLGLGLIICQAKSSEAAALGTAFTYQGHLYDANDVANGPYDFAFKLYDANVGGSKAANDVNVADVDVIDGYFTVGLDFGSSVFDGNAVWLEIGVRPGDKNDPNAYTVLNPRQRVAPVPYAIYAKAADGVAGVITGSGTVNCIPKFMEGAKLANSVIYESTGNVGVGTQAAQKLLHIVQKDGGYDGLGIRLDPHGFGFAGGTIWDIDNDVDFKITQYRPVPGYPKTRLTISDGKVGIGTTAPEEELHVLGSVKIVDGNQGSNKVLTSDANGVGSWQSPSVPESVPSGVIVMWSGDTATIPAGWVLCDGDNNTPDLKGKFIVGAGGRGGPGKTNIGGSKMNTKAESQIGGRDDNKGDLHNTEGGSLGEAKADKNHPRFYTVAFIMKL
jgi:hypothetical protein